MNHYNVLGVPYNASLDEIKRAYKDIALKCHPDKLTQMIDDNVKKERIEKFKEASIAYNELLGKADKNDCIGEEDFTNWKDIWYSVFSNSTETKEIIRDTFVDIASTFIKSQIYPKSYYNVSSNVSAPKRHEVSAEITYREILLNVKKKLRLILVDIDEPLFVDMSCGKFPQVIKEYTDDYDNEHEIVINMIIKEQDNFDHVIHKSGRIDLITTVDVSLLEYSTGFDRSIKHADGEYISVSFPEHCGDTYEVANRGINNGSLFVNVSVRKILTSEWNRLSQEDKAAMVRILKLLCV